MTWEGTSTNDKIQARRWSPSAVRPTWGWSEDTDCNNNGIPDECDVLSGTSEDCDQNGIPDDCMAPAATPDCNNNGVNDYCEITADPSLDSDADGVLDSCTFLRGDANVDGSVDAADPIVILGYLFQGSPVLLLCPDAADVNDDEAVHVSDAINLLAFLFGSGTPPGLPGVSNCGLDPAGVVLGCGTACP